MIGIERENFRIQYRSVQLDRFALVGSNKHISRIACEYLYNIATVKIVSLFSIFSAIESKFVTRIAFRKLATNPLVN